MAKKIVIIGAAGYVGIELVSQLQNLSDYELFAFTRDNGSFLLEGKKINLLKEEDIKDHQPFDILVNLAYPTVPNPVFFPEVNRGIFSTIKKLVSPNTRIIHVSTQALFGYGMDKPIVADFVKKRRDFGYIEAKEWMENEIKKAFPANNLSIVRLGNVWGPGSGIWTGAVADKLLFGQFIAVEGEDGFANITDVKNVASYILYLIKSENIKGTHIYHLAEFSYIKWSQIIDLMARELKVEPVYSTIKPFYPLTLKAEISRFLKLPSVGDTYREWIWGRFVGSYLRGIIRFMGAERFQKIQKNEVKSLPQTQVLSKFDLAQLIVVSAATEFKTVTDAGWKPAINFDESWQIVKDWMKDVGYLNEVEVKN